MRTVSLGEARGGAGGLAFLCCGVHSGPPGASPATLGSLCGKGVFVTATGAGAALSGKAPAEGPQERCLHRPDRREAQK